MFEQFSVQDIPAPHGTIRARVAGDGDPLLLLHGYPQTHAMWHELAPRFLAQGRRVVLADLTGYGDSTSRDGDFTFRAMADDMAAVMDELRADRFDVVAHDRGARVTHRLLLDHQERVRSVALLDILPTLTVWEHMDAWLAKRYYHWTFLAQPPPMPQQLISKDPVRFLHAALGGLSGPLEVFDPEAMAAYEAAAAKPSVVAAWCGDYAAAADADLVHDRADVGRAIDVPALLLWGSRGVVGEQVDPLDAWRPWLPKVRGHAIDAGHFLVEEQPDVVFTELSTHLDEAVAAQRT